MQVRIGRLSTSQLQHVRDALVGLQDLEPPVALTQSTKSSATATPKAWTKILERLEDANFQADAHQEARGNIWHGSMATVKMAEQRVLDSFISLRYKILDALSRIPKQLQLGDELLNTTRPS